MVQTEVVNVYIFPWFLWCFFCVCLSSTELITCPFTFYGPCSVVDTVMHGPDPLFRQTTHSCQECWQRKTHRRVPLWEWSCRRELTLHPSAGRVEGELASSDQLLQDDSTGSSQGQRCLQNISTSLSHLASLTSYRCKDLLLEHYQVNLLYSFSQSWFLREPDLRLTPCIIPQLT